MVKTMTKDEVKDLRKRLSLTQAELAQKVGVNVRTVRRWEIESGVRGTTATLFDRLRLEEAVVRTMRRTHNDEQAG